MSQFEKFVTEGNEKAQELAEAGRQCWSRSKSKDNAAGKRGRCMQLCSMRPASTAWWRNRKIAKSSCPSRKKSGFFVDKKRENTRHRTEWCAEANRYRCTRCGRGSKYMKMPGKCTGPKFLPKSLGKWRRRHLGGHDLVRSMDRLKKRERRTISWQTEGVGWITKVRG